MEGQFDIAAAGRPKSPPTTCDLELLKSQCRAFLTAGATVQPPTEGAVTKAEGLAAKLAAPAAEESQASAIIKIATDGLNAFNKLNKAA
jgi:hypothetical protein